MSMTKKDFEAIARAIRIAHVTYDTPTDAAQREFIAREVAQHCEAANPQFNRARFLAACGVQS